MQHFEIPELPTRSGEEAIKALHEYIKKLEEQETEELTENQKKTLIKLSRGLISTIEAETQAARLDKKTKSPSPGTQLKRTITSLFQNYTREFDTLLFR